MHHYPTQNTLLVTFTPFVPFFHLWCHHELQSALFFTFLSLRRHYLYQSASISCSFHQEHIPFTPTPCAPSCISRRLYFAFITPKAHPIPPLAHSFNYIKRIMGIFTHTHSLPHIWPRTHRTITTLPQRHHKSTFFHAPAYSTSTIHSIHCALKSLTWIDRGRSIFDSLGYDMHHTALCMKMHK